VAKLLAEEPANGGIDIEYQLLEAAKAGDLELVRKIVGLHPHIVNCRDLDGRHSTPLHFAAGQLACCFVFSVVRHGGVVSDYCNATVYSLVD
jgi:tankyrase